MKHGHSAEPSPRARKSAAEERLEALVHSQSAEVLLDVAANPALTEDLALALLARRDLPRGLIEILVKNAAVMKSRPVLNAVARHPKTPPNRRPSSPPSKLFHPKSVPRIKDNHPAHCRHGS